MTLLFMRKNMETIYMYLTIATLNIKPTEVVEVVTVQPW